MLEPERFQCRLGLLGLGFRQIERLDQDQLAVQRAIRDCEAQRLPPRLFRHFVRIVTRQRSEDSSAVTPNRRPGRASARPSGALLPPRLFAAAGDQARESWSRQFRHGASPTASAPLRAATTYRRCDRTPPPTIRTRRCVLDSPKRAELSPIRSLLSPATNAFAALHPSAFASSATRRVFAACCTITKPPSAPGTHPETTMALSSASISTTRRFTMVAFSLPI